jgi:hypothetical protein
MNHKLFTYFLAILWISVACAQRSETRKLPSFDELSVGESITVEMRKGSSEEAIVEVRGADLDDVLTDVIGGRLKIEMRYRMGYRNVDVRVRLTFVELEEISVSSSADLFCEDVITGKSLELDVSSSGDASLKIDVEELEVEVSSSGDLELEGNCESQYVRASSSGDYNGFDLVSSFADIRASSGADVEVNVTEEIEADASSGASIYYRGNPDKVYVDSSSGGKVRKY